MDTHTPTHGLEGAGAIRGLDYYRPHPRLLADTRLPTLAPPQGDIQLEIVRSIIPPSAEHLAGGRGASSDICLPTLVVL